MSALFKFVPCDERNIQSFDVAEQQILRNWMGRGIHVSLVLRPDGSLYVHGIIFRGHWADDADAKNAAIFSQVRALAFDNTAITDAGLRYLAKLERLESLDLDGTAITDEGLGYLQHAPSLEYLHVNGTAITRDGIEFLQFKRPRMQISSDLA
jgi:hypothetical protein